MGLLKVEGHLNLYKDEETGAVLNMDDTAYNQYIMSRRYRDEKKKSQREEIENIKNEISEIKSLLSELISETRRN
jgi:predicted AlkP superfamily phosphohydrolase/phosphomutase